MGAGSSVLPEELSQQLTQPSLQKFHQLQVECEAKKLAPLDTYLFLQHKFEELLAAEKEAIHAITSKNNKEDAPHLQNSEGSHYVKSTKSSTSAHKRAQYRPKSARTKEKDSSAIHRFLPKKKQMSTHLESDLLSQEIADHMLDSEDVQLQDGQDESLQTQLLTVGLQDDPYLNDIVRRVFGIVDDHHSKHLVDTMLQRGTAPSAESSSGKGSQMSHSQSAQQQHQLTMPDDQSCFVRNDPSTSTWECLLCHMAFNSSSALRSHLKTSPVHAVNFRVRQEICRSTAIEAQRLTVLARTVVATMQNQATSSSSNAGGHSNRWQQATRQVIAARLKARFLPALEAWCEVPVGVRLLHAGSRFFTTQHRRADIRLYLHLNEDIVEVVTHLLPRCPTAAASSYSAKKGKYMDTADSENDSDKEKIPSNSHVSITVKALPRLFLNHRILLSSALGQLKPESALLPSNHQSVAAVEGGGGGLISAAASAKLTAISGYDNSHNSNNEDGNDSNDDDIEEGCSGRDQLKAAMERALVGFVLACLTLIKHPVTVSKRGHHHYAKWEMIFEARSMLNSPLLSSSSLPAGLQKVPLSPEQVQRHYDQLQSEQEEGQERAELLSRHLAAVREGSQEDMNNALRSPMISQSHLQSLQSCGKGESVFDLLMTKTASTIGCGQSQDDDEEADEAELK